MPEETRLIERWLPVAQPGIESTRKRASITPFPAPDCLHVWWVQPPLSLPPSSVPPAAESVLREVLVRLWKQVRAKKAEVVASLTVRLFEAGAAFRLLGAGETATINGGYEARDGGTFQLKFRGPVSDAQPVRGFLEPQFRSAKEADFTAGFGLTFDDGLSMKSNAAEKLTGKLSRFASGAGVSMTAEAKA